MLKLNKVGFNHEKKHKIWEFSMYFLTCGKISFLLMHLLGFRSKKLRCPSSCWLAAFPAQISSAWKISVQTHNLLL